MPNNEENRGGSHEQHVKAGQQSHKNQGSQGSGGSTGEGSGRHGDPEGHAEAGRKGGEAVSKDREHMAEIGREGDEARGQGQNSNSSTGSRGGSHEQHVKAGQQSHKNK